MNTKEEAKKILKYHTDLHGDMGKYYAIKSTEQKKYSSDIRYAQQWNDLIEEIKKINVE
jgi:hypothetical protein